MGFLDIFKKKEVHYQPPMSKAENAAMQDADVGKQMGSLIIKKVERIENDESIIKSYTLSDNVQEHNVRDVIEFFEGETAVMTKCFCQSFDDNGHPLHCIYTDKARLSEIKDLPNPYIRFCIHLHDVKTNRYAFTLEMHINSDRICYKADKLKQKKTEAQTKSPGTPISKENMEKKKPNDALNRAKYFESLSQETTSEPAKITPVDSQKEPAPVVVAKNKTCNPVKEATATIDFCSAIHVQRLEKIYAQPRMVAFGEDRPDVIGELVVERKSERRKFFPLFTLSADSSSIGTVGLNNHGEAILCIEHNIPDRLFSSACEYRQITYDRLRECAKQAGIPGEKYANLNEKTWRVFYPKKLKPPAEFAVGQAMDVDGILIHKVFSQGCGESFLFLRKCNTGYRVLHIFSKIGKAFDEMISECPDEDYIKKFFSEMSPIGPVLGSDRLLGQDELEYITHIMQKNEMYTASSTNDISVKLSDIEKACAFYYKDGKRFSIPARAIGALSEALWECAEYGVTKLER